MSSARLQDTKSASKNQAYFYILAMNNSKLKKKEDPICDSIRKNKILRNTKEWQDFYNEN